MFRTIRFLVCLTITFRVPHFLFFSLFNYYVGVLRTILVCLTITFRVPHHLFFSFFTYYVGILCTICFLVCLTISLGCCELHVLLYV